MASRSSVEPTETFGGYLRFLRRRARLTQTELSVAVGYSPGQISMLENGQRTPDAAAVMALFVEALGLQGDRQAAATLIELAHMAALRTQRAPAAGDSSLQPAVRSSVRQTVTWQEEVLGIIEEIPPLPVCYVQRTQANEQIARWLLQERRAAICGLPGMGKSTLAAAFAREYARQHPVCWLTFDQEHNRSAEDVVRQLALFGLSIGAAGAHVPVLRRIATGAASTPLRQQVLAVATALQASRAPLLVFDDVQFAAEFPALTVVITKLMAGAPYCCVLFVTREMLDFAGTPHLMLGGLARDEALTLLNALCAPPGAPLAAGRAPASDVFEQILTHTAGNPLLLRLAASRLEQTVHLPPALFGAQLADGLVDTLLTWLSPAGRRILDLLTVARTPLNLDAPGLAELLSGGDPGYGHNAAVNQLVRGRLIEHRACAGLHPLLREPLLANMEARPTERRLIHQLAGRWAILQGDFVGAAHHCLRAGDLMEACTLLVDARLEHLPAGEVNAAVAVLDEAASSLRRSIHLPDYRSTLGALLARRGDWLINTSRAAEARVDYRRAIAATDAPLPRLQLAYRLAMSLLQVGQAHDALQLCIDAAQQLAGLTETAAIPVRAQLTGAHVRALLGMGRLEEAAALCQEAIAAARTLRLTDPTLAEKVCTDAYRGLGYIARRQGRNADARVDFLRAASHARSAGLHREEAETLGHLSATLRELGDFAGAFQHGRHALAVAQNAGNDYLAANLLHHMSITSYFHAQLAQALAYSEQAAILHQAMGDSEGMVSCDILQAVVYAAIGPLSSAIAAIDRALSNSQLFDNRWLQGMALYVYGIVHTFAGNLAAAAATLDNALSIPAFASDPPQAASALLFLGINAIAQGDLTRAQKILRELPAPCAIEVELLTGLFHGMLYLAAEDATAAAAAAADTQRRSVAAGYLIYAAEAARLQTAVAEPPPQATLPAFVCCGILPDVSEKPRAAGRSNNS